MNALRVRLSYTLVIASFAWAAHAQPPPRLNIYHFDVNIGDATLILSPDGRGVLIDAGNKGRGLNPIKEFLDRAKQDGHLTSLDYVIATHYDADHIGGMEELFRSGWYPAIHVYDRGDTLLPVFDRSYVETTSTCSGVNPDDAEQIVPWGTAPSSSCPATSRHAKCPLVKYFIAAQEGGRRATLLPGDTLHLDHGLEIITLVANAVDVDGEAVDVHFTGRRDDCAANDLSLGVLVQYGDFRYLTAGDLTGDRDGSMVADVEELLKDNLQPLDVYHANHHGSKTSSMPDFMQVIHPAVVIVSNGKGTYGHPSREVVANRILTLDPPPAVYLTNLNDDPAAWQPPPDRVADIDVAGYDGIVELAVWKRSYRVFRWRDGNRLGGGDRYLIRGD